MSHSDGKVIKDGMVIGYFEYNGTCDVAISAVWDTSEEMLQHWRSSIWNRCECGQPHTDVKLWTSYAGGFHWDGTVCLTCRSIETGQMPYGYDDLNKVTEGYPLAVD